MKEAFALSVYVFKNPVFSDCSNGGISEKYDKLLLVGKGVEGYIQVDFAVETISLLSLWMVVA